MQSRQLQNIALRIEKKRGNIERDQKTLLKDLCHYFRENLGRYKPERPVELRLHLFEDIFNAFQPCRIGSKAIFPEAVIESVSLFKTVPGYALLLKKIIENTLKDKEHELRGALYELEKAIAITHARKEAIKEFGKKMSKYGREIDVVTNERWIECKAWDNFAPKKIRKLKKQVEAQKEMAYAYNQLHQPLITFEVSFKNGIPTELQYWFEQNNIPFTVG